MDTDPNAAAQEFLKAHGTGTLATVAPDGAPRARTVYYAADEAFNIYFLTLSMTRKAEDIERHDRAAFVVSDDEKPQTVQLEGVVSDVTKDRISERVLRTLFERLNSNTEYFAPLARLDQSQVRFYVLTPTWVRWGDFTSEHGTRKVLVTLAP